MSFISFFHGGGRRRRSTENWDDLERRLSDAEARAKNVKGAHFHRCPTDTHPPYWVYAQGVACPWCLVDQLRGQLELVTTRPAPRPGGVAVQAPADGARIARPADEPDADPNAETQAVALADVDKALGLDDTIQIPPMPTNPPVVPVVAVEPVPRVTWGITATKPLWQVPAGPGSSRPEELSPTAGRLATVRVADAMNEAS